MRTLRMRLATIRVRGCAALRSRLRRPLRDIRLEAHRTPLDSASQDELHPRVSSSTPGREASHTCPLSLCDPKRMGQTRLRSWVGWELRRGAAPSPFGPQSLFPRRVYSGRLVHPVHDVVRVGDSGEDEVVVVAGRGVEVDVADLHQALVDRLLVVDVLDALEAGLLDLARDDATADVEAAV